jgi:hypothetical protein
MNEAEWLACDDSGPILAFLRGRASERKLRLFACACVRAIAHLMPDKRSHHALQVAERFADGLARQQEMEAAREARLGAHGDYSGWATLPDATRAAVEAPSWTARAAMLAVRVGKRTLAYNSARSAQAALLRDIFGPLAFRPLPRLNPAWLTWEGVTVPKLAASIHDERAFDRLPILADALEEAGCDAAELLAHMRGPRPHVRGCWAVDLLLGKG